MSTSVISKKLFLISFSTAHCLALQLLLSVCGMEKSTGSPIKKIIKKRQWRRAWEFDECYVVGDGTNLCSEWKHEELVRCREWIGRCRHWVGDGDEWSFLICIASALIVLISMRGTEQVAAQKPPRPLACRCSMMICTNVTNKRYSFRWFVPHEIAWRLLVPNIEYLCDIKKTVSCLSWITVVLKSKRWCPRYIACLGVDMGEEKNKMKRSCCVGGSQLNPN